METTLIILIPAIIETVFASLAEATGLSDWLRQRLGRDPEKLAFQQSLTQALTDTAPHFPGRDLRYFGEVLRDVGGPLLARTLQPAAPPPTAQELTRIWLNHLTIDSFIHYRQDFETFATRFLDRLTFHIDNQQPLQWIVQARRARGNEETLYRLAVAAEQSATNLDALRSEIAATFDRLQDATRASGVNLSSDGSNNTLSTGHIAGRDLTIKNYFVAGLARLVNDYSVRIENFLFTYLGGQGERVPFGGRQQQLDELNAWLDDPNAPPYTLLVAEAGKGKSALVCRWSAQLLTRPNLDVIFVPIRIRFQTAAQDVFFAALAARLIQIHEEKTTEHFHKPTTAEEWKAVCEGYLRRPLPEGKRLLLIVDGLDEATDWLAGPELFAVRPPAGLRVLVTARLRARETDAEGWAATLQWESPRLARKLTLPSLDRAGVAEALASMGNPLDWLASQMDIVGKLYYLSEGDPLLVRLYVDELDKARARTPFLTPADLETLQPGLAAFLQKWWEDQRKQWWMQKKDPHSEEERLLPLLHACALALGPLLLKDLAALDAAHFGVARTVVNRAEVLGRWLIGDGERQGYVFAHPRLREFFAGPTWLSAEETAVWQGKFCGWGERVLADLNGGKLEPKQAPEYLLRNYAAHLAQSGAPDAQFYALISNGWRQAWEWLDVSYGGFLNDVDRAWERARGAYEPSRPGRAEALVQQVRAGLCRASVAALSSNMPPELLAQLVAAGLRTPTQALAIVKLVTETRKQSEMLAALVVYLPVALLEEALSIAYRIENEFYRASALNALTPRLPESQQIHVLDEALTAARAIEYESSRANALSALAPTLPEYQRSQVLEQALRIAMTIKEDFARASALAVLYPHLPVTLLAEALEDAQSIENKYYRAKALSALAPHLPAPLLAEAVAATRAIGDNGSLAFALNALARHLPDNEREQVLAEALDAVRSIGDELDRAKALSALASHLPAPLLVEAVAITRAIRNKGSLASALSALAHHLPDSEREQVLAEALDAVRSIGDELDRAKTLSALASHLPAPLLVEAVAITRSIRKKGSLASVLSALAHYLPDSEREQVIAEALDAARAIGGESSRVSALSTLALHLPELLLPEALYTARAIGGDFARAKALLVLAPHLSDSKREQVLAEALDAARAIGDEFDRSRALITLAPHLPAPLLAEVLVATRAMRFDMYRSFVLSMLVPHLATPLLEEALAAIRAIDSESDRAYALSFVVPHLPESERSRVLAEALEAARAIRNESDRANALSFVIPHLPERQRDQILKEAVVAARASGKEKRSVTALSSLSQYLPERQRVQVLAEALAIARAFWNEFERADLLSELARHLPYSERVQVLAESVAVARVRGDKRSLASALSALAPQLPENERVQMLAEALAIASAINNGSSRTNVLLALVQQLLGWAAQQPNPSYRAFADTLTVIAAHPRSEFITDLTILMPFLLALAGDEAPQAAAGIFQAIQEICAWWP